MEVHQAEAFLAVAEELHFGRAAARLRIAQPPLSRLIKQLERSLSATLFERTTRHVELTAAGRALVEPAERLVEASRAAREAVRGAVTGETGRVKLGFAGASINRKVGELARRITAQQPGLLLELHSSQFSHVGLERVLDGSLDMAIGRWDFVPPEIASRVIAVEEVMVGLPSRHRLAGKDRVSMKELADESWITLPGGASSALTNRLRTLSMRAGFVPRVLQTAPDSWTQVVLVGAGMGCALTLDSVRDNVSTDGVSFVSLVEERSPLEVRLIWLAEKDDAALHLVAQAAASLFPDPRPARPDPSPQS